MKIEDFMEKFRSCKSSTCMAMLDDGIRVIKVTRGCVWKLIGAPNKCKCCGRGDKSTELRLVFEKPVDHLTIFQAGLLWMVYIEGKRPYDYAKYHECPAGKKFIENIRSVEVIK